jgi:hypothetical protein
MTIVIQCLHLGCLRPVEPGSKYCLQHQPAVKNGKAQSHAS